MKCFQRDEIAALFLPRPKKAEDIIEYARSRMMLTDLLGVMLLLLFFGLPFLINGGNGINNSLEQAVNTAQKAVSKSSSGSGEGGGLNFEATVKR